MPSPDAKADAAFARFWEGYREQLATSMSFPSEAAREVVRSLESVVMIAWRAGWDAKGEAERWKKN